MAALTLWFWLYKCFTLTHGFDVLQCAPVVLHNCCSGISFLCAGVYAGTAWVPYLLPYQHPCCITATENAADIVCGPEDLHESTRLYMSLCESVL
jgi:hypothetical protein